MQQIGQLFGKLLPFAATFVAGVVASFGSGFVREFFEERNRVATHKRNVARHVLKICIEASTNNFRCYPYEKIESIHSVLVDLEGINNQIEKELTQFVGLWRTISELYLKSWLNMEGKEHLSESLKSIERKRKILILWANSLRVGRNLS